MGDYKCNVTAGLLVYGLEKYIRISILSVLNQIFQDKLEVLVIDDLKSKRCLDIVRGMQYSHPTVE